MTQPGYSLPLSLIYKADLLNAIPSLKWAQKCCSKKWYMA